MYPYQISSIEERFFRQAWETVYDNRFIIHDGDVISAYNRNVNQSGYSPALTTRPDGFKTAILIVRKYDKD